jgi:glutathione S-transferase
MKLYMHPVSTTSRPVMQFIADNNIKVDMEVVDILKGQHYEPAYSKLNPNHLIPMLDDDGFRLTESAAILRYLAEKTGSPTYPKDLKARAKVNEAMDWSKAWLQVLNDHWIGPSDKYLCGNQLTIADYFGAAITTAGELIHCDLSTYPNIKRWLDTFKAGPNYATVYETFTGFCASTKGQAWQAI